MPDIVATEQDLSTARKGLLMHLDAVADESIDYSMQDFIDLETKVLATLRAYNRHLENIIHNRGK